MIEISNWVNFLLFLQIDDGKQMLNVLFDVFV